MQCPAGMAKSWRTSQDRAVDKGRRLDNRGGQPYRLPPSPRGRALMPDLKHAAFSGRLVILGFGSIGQGVLPLLLRHIDLRPDQITIITAELHGHEVAE